MLLDRKISDLNAKSTLLFILSTCSMIVVTYMLISLVSCMRGCEAPKSVSLSDVLLTLRSPVKVTAISTDPQSLSGSTRVILVDVDGKSTILYDPVFRNCKVGDVIK